MIPSFQPLLKPEPIGALKTPVDATSVQVANHKSPPTPSYGRRKGRAEAPHSPGLQVVKDGHWEDCSPVESRSTGFPSGCRTPSRRPSVARDLTPSGTTRPPRYVCEVVTLGDPTAHVRSTRAANVGAPIAQPQVFVIRLDSGSNIRSGACNTLACRGRPFLWKLCPCFGSGRNWLVGCT